MECGFCEVDMDIVEDLFDFNDPNSPNGHGQHEGKHWECPKCGRTEPFYTEPEEE